MGGQNKDEGGKKLGPKSGNFVHPVVLDQVLSGARSGFLDPELSGARFIELNPLP